MPRRFPRPPLPLALLLCIAAVQGIAWIAAAAPLTGPDEIEHYGYIQHLAETGHAPNHDSGTGSNSTELTIALGELELFPIRGHPEARPAWDRVGEVTRQLDALPASARKNGSGPNPAGNYPPLYYALGAIAYRLSPDASFLARVTAVRLVGVALLVITVGLAWLIAAELLASMWARTVATGLVALQPKLGFMSAAVNPDILLVAITTAFLLAALRLVRRGPTLERVATVAVLAGAGALTHGRGLALVPPALLAVGIALWQARPPLRAALGHAALATVLLAGSVLLAAAWTRAHATGGISFGGQATVKAGFKARELISQVWQFYLPKLSFMDARPGPAYGYRQVFIDTYFGSYGALEVNFRNAIYDWLQIGAGVGLVALYTTSVVRFRAVLARWGEVLVAAATFVSMMALLHFVSYQSLRPTGDPVITGRYLLPCVALYGCAAAWVAASLPRRLGPLLGAVLLSSSALLSVGAIGLTFARFHG